MSEMSPAARSQLNQSFEDVLAQRQLLLDRLHKVDALLILLACQGLGITPVGGELVAPDRPDRGDPHRP